MWTGLPQLLHLFVTDWAAAQIDNRMMANRKQRLGPAASFANSLRVAAHNRTERLGAGRYAAHLVFKLFDFQIGIFFC